MANIPIRRLFAISSIGPNKESKEESDNVFRLAMLDFRIGIATVETIFNAVRLFGGSAWSDNARLRANGEKRTLSKFPDDPRTTWAEWKEDPTVFASR
jgi:hypothetical protein